MEDILPGRLPVRLHDVESWRAKAIAQDLGNCMDGPHHVRCLIGGQGPQVSRVPARYNQTVTRCRLSPVEEGHRGVVFVNTP